MMKTESVLRRWPRTSLDKMYEHIPVMGDEIIRFVRPERCRTIVDCTVGLGGYALRIFQEGSFNGTYIGLDKDEESLSIAEQKLASFNGRVFLHHRDFKDIDSVLEEQGCPQVDGIIFDLGLSSYQLEFAERGFSFRREGPLDMRMDRYASISAYDLVNNLSERELSLLLWQFGQERYHQRIAHKIVTERKAQPIATTSQLTEIIASALPGFLQHHTVHPVTKSFQALRIVVNNELAVLKDGLRKASNLLARGGRICVVDFHSLEDRVVKYEFLELKKKKTFRLVTEKPLPSSSAERRLNNRARSAKLRVVEKI